MIVWSYSNIDIIQGVIGYGNASEGITDWRIQNSSSGVFNILNSSSGSIITPSGGTSTIGGITGSTDRYMIFSAGTSTFTVPSGGIKCDILMIGGGGAGGWGKGGGGAGSCIIAIGQTFAANANVSVSVGAGDVASTSTTGVGGDSSITISSTLRYLAKGGGRGAYEQTDGINGGCGGGAGMGKGATRAGGISLNLNVITLPNGTTITTGPTNTETTYAVFGNKGGDQLDYTNNQSSDTSCGGGGIGAPGVNKLLGSGSSAATAGGNGLNSATINGTQYNFQSYFANGGAFGADNGYIGGGGGGGAYWSTVPASGGLGGGGAGAANFDGISGVSAIANTGSGGGGRKRSGGLQGSGGSGIIIIRYSTTLPFSIIENGNVGIGITPITTSSLLEVAGDVNITGNYRINNTDVINSTSNYVLSTSNLLVSRIQNEVNNASNYVGSVNTALNTRINNTSNYIVTTNNILQNTINSQWTTTTSGIYYNTPISEPITLPSDLGKDMYMTFTYTTETISGTGQKQYTINVPSGGIVCDILIVGGGGGGGARHAGGGGAGAVIYLTNQILTTGTYTINVGNGGAGSQLSGNGGPGSKGIDTSIRFNSNDIYLAKGGGAGDNIIGTGVIKDGGSGGGGYGNAGNAVSTNIPTGIYGNSGGLQTVGAGASYFGGGGGGGALTAGANAVIGGTTTTGGNGGSGRIISITGTSVYYGGGGGGGVASTANIAGQGGLGGGGSGSKGAVTATSGNPGTGSGGGGSGFSDGSNGIAGNGGSGIVIIRFNTFIPLTLQNSIISSPIITPNIIELPGVITWTIGMNEYFILNYTLDNTGTGQSRYTINVPPGGLTCDILLVGGGGGGGGTAGSGGGGDVIEINNLTLQSGVYTINVGQGGIGGTTNSTLGTNGINSSFSGLGISVQAGGGGGGWALWTGTNGGNLPTLSYFTHPITGVSTPTCGGVGGTGGDYNKNNAKSVANSPSGSGGTSDNPVVGGAGGGAAPSTLGNGGNSTNAAGGSGGKGIVSTITGTSIEYGGGGGAGSWNLSGLNPAGTATGGGGSQITNGGSFIDAVNGTGGGGSLSRNGGSGVVIMKFTLQNALITPSIIESPGVIAGTIETDRYIILTYTTDNTGTGQTQYNINIPTDNIICDILMVGGGGAGGKDIGGGGGGAAVLYGTNISISKTNYIVKVGRGATPGEVRGKSTEGFGATVLGGGSANNLGWNNNVSVNGNTGGSGGGGKGTNVSTSVSTGGVPGISTKGAIIASSIIYNGNRGGSGMMQVSGNQVAGGGGGGASGIGTNANISATGRGGNGGDGIEINIIGTSYWWGAGGGGGSQLATAINGGDGGKGGGGGGGQGSNGGSIGTVGTNGYGVASGKNAGSGTGSGGGGSGYTDTISGNGGSGIIIIRYRNNLSIANVGIGTTNPNCKLQVFDNITNNTTLTIQNNYIDPVTITPNTRHTVTETIENNRYYRTLTFTYNVSYPVLADDANNLFAWYKLDGNLIDSTRFQAVATLPNGAITYTTDTSKFSNLPNYISATFNGTASANGAYALTPPIYKDVPLSFAFWFMTTGTAYYTMMGYGDKSANTPKIQFDFLLTSGTSYQLNVYTALNNTWTTTPIATGLSLNTWYFCVYTLSNTSPVNCILYINGTQRATGSGNAGQTLSVNKDLTIGASGDGERGFVGQLADIRIYNKVLSLAEITTLYTVNTPASIVSTINFRVPTTIFVNGGSGVSVNGLYNISVGPTNSSVLKAQTQAVDPYPSTAITTISIKYEYKDATLSLPKLINVPGTTTTTIGTTDRCISFPYIPESTTIAYSGQTQYTFSPSETIVCDILLVGGGGSGGSAGGPGGGGDVLEFNNITLNPGSYKILVGNGGVYFPSNVVTGAVGKNSSITINDNTVTAAGGGGGGGYGYSPATGWTGAMYPSAIPTVTFRHPITLQSMTSQGGGGGAAGKYAVAGAVGTGISGNGGRSTVDNETVGGGGGGAAPPPLGNGKDTFAQILGDGGMGISSYITGTLVEYGGGGAAGKWNGKLNVEGIATGGGGYQRWGTGAVNTAIGFPGENGRGGGGTQSVGGGSGIVIIRYRKVVSSASIELIRLSNNSVNEIVIAGTTSTVIGSDRCIQFPYSGSGTFTSYSFTTSETLICDLLIVGGGGGGSAGGGGGGGYLYYTNINLPAGNYAVNVGNGGTGATSTTNGNQGANSSFIGGSLNHIYIAYGGGGGGGNTQIAPAHTTGQVGSYGGNGHDNTTTQTYTSTQGNIGGKALVNSAGSGGGGGGASRNGGDAIIVAGIVHSGTTAYYKGGKGGDGALNNITNIQTYYAGGGTAGANTNSGTDTNTQIAPLGGGGLGALAPNANGTNGTNGLGGGGGGGDWERTAGTTGGSGIVIMRYRKVANYKIGNFSGDFKIISTSTTNNNIEYMRIAENGSSIYNATGTPLWSTVSDLRIKENIERASYEKCYNNIQNLELYRFNYISELNNINKDLKQLGYIAQEVNEIFPKSVSSQSLYNNTLSMSDLLSIDITQINYTLFGSVKRLIELIKNKITRLEKLENIINNRETSNLLLEVNTSNLNVEEVKNILLEETTSNLNIE